MQKPISHALRTRQDVADAALRMIEPLVSCLTPGKARMIVGEGSAHYPEDVAGMEGFSRVLWALVPLMIGRFPEAEPYWLLWREGIINGTDPAHGEYWGDLHSSDQRMVEMAVIGTGLCFLPDRFYGDLTPKQQEIYDHRFDMEEEEETIGQEKLMVETAAVEIPKSFILFEENGLYKICFSPLSSASLRGRMNL